MDNIRFKVLMIAMNRPQPVVDFPKRKASDYYGELTFNRAAMKEYLTEEAFIKIGRASCRERV